MQRVKVGKLYRFEPVWFDKSQPPFGANAGDTVKVVNLPGCPKANTMGMCYIATKVASEWRFAGMVCTNSLQPLAEG